MKWAAIGCALGLLVGSANAEDEGVCSHLRAFETAPRIFAANGTTRDWIEMRWVGLWMDLDNGWHLSCADSGSDAGKKLCGWLIQHTSFEFPDHFPIGILECHGFKFPIPHPISDKWIETLSLFPEQGEQHMKLEIALGGHKGDNAVRYSVFLGPTAEQKNPLPPLFSPTDYVGTEVH